MRLSPYIYILTLIGLQRISAFFFHEPSYVVFSPEHEKTFDFGFSLAYLEKNRALVTGAPHADINGAVYNCPVEESVHKNSVICSKNDINIDILAKNYSREQSPDQNFCLGASLAVSDSYVFTCAPLWSKEVTTLNDMHIYGAFGTCFISDESSRRYKGMLEQYEMRDFENVEIPPTFDDIYGGVGWSTLVDKENDLIIIAKPALISSISYMSASNLDTYAKIVPLDVAGLLKYLYKGRAFAAGTYFSNFPTVYAFSMEKDKRTGAVGFLQYDKKSQKLRVLQKGTRAVLYENRVVGAMFGAALHSVDMTGDKFSELVVGAPGEPCWENGLEVGAIYIYVGGDKAKSKREATLRICGNEDNSRLGTAVSSLDLNEDSYPEIFISAPYEKNGYGVLYVLSGYEIHKKYLKTHRSSQKVFISELTYVQRISNNRFTNFGYSLQALPDFNKEGANALAIGSPTSERVILYRSIPFITVTVSTKLLGKETIHELDTNFTVRVETRVTYPKRVNITAKLLQSVSLTANAAKSFDSDDFVINLSSNSNQTIFINDVTVTLYDEQPGLFKFQAEVKIDEATFHKKVFDSALVSFSEQSKTKTVLDITRISNASEPKLSIVYAWSGLQQEQYVLGSSTTEVMTVVVRNDGTNSDWSCAWIRVSGAPVTLLECDQPQDSWYKCNFFNLGRREKRLLDIILDMSTLSNKDDKLKIEVLLFNTCDSSRSNATSSSFKEIKYKLNPSDIIVDGMYQDQNITASKIQSDDDTDIETSVLYVITNNGSVLWESVTAQFSVNPIFMDNFTIISRSIHCELDNETNLSYSCVLDLKPKNNVKIVASTKIPKKNIMNLFKNNRIFVETVLKLSLNGDIVTKTLNTTLFYQNDITFGQNRNLVILIASILAALLLIVVIFGLYKAGFFKRANKKKLNDLRASIKRPPPPQSAGTSNSQQTNSSGDDKAADRKSKIESMREDSDEVQSLR
ncbi:integrin alpha-PS3-like isoform X2 [Colias croceus]|uniref:integrin alpha-PS3-like isoform X2 n=1 Tax=Colias crocea TaxID=72248 RepID=UPI001E27E4F4|nr:integrin alpha-PS3-like isoform X2 [Colias croceus]